VVAAVVHKVKNAQAAGQLASRKIKRFDRGSVTSTAPRLLRRAVVGLLLAALPVGGIAAAAEEKIVVASKIDTEGALLGNIILAILQAHGLTVENKLQLGPTNIVRAAILAGQIDIYPEYTGNGALFFHKEEDPAWKNWAQGYALVEKLCREQNQLIWLTPAPA